MKGTFRDNHWHIVTLTCSDVLRRYGVCQITYSIRSSKMLTFKQAKNAVHKCIAHSYKLKQSGRR